LVTQSCKKSTGVKLPQVSNQSFVEEFDTIAEAVSRGWKFINTSDPKGNGTWESGGGNPPFFNAYSNKGINAGFIGADYLSTSAEQGIISNWLVSPVVTMRNGDKIIFYTRSYQLFDGISDTTDFGNSLQVRINPLNDSTDVGQGLDVGSFTNNLLTINRKLTWSSVITPGIIAYPSQWTRFEITIQGLTDSLKSRFAFRYFVTNGGSNGNGTGVGIDSVAYESQGF
jgi:hypothetical protein